VTSPENTNLKLYPNFWNYPFIYFLLQNKVLSLLF